MFKHQRKKPEFLKYFKNTSWLLAEKAFRMAITLFVGVWVIRYLGPEKFGQLSYVTSIVVLFSAFAGLGLDAIIVRELVNSPDQKNKIIGTAFTLKLMAAVVVILLLLAFTTLFFEADTIETTYIVIISFSSIFISFNIIDFYFQSQVLSRYVVFTNVIVLLVSSTLKIYFIVSAQPLIMFVYVIVFDSFVTTIGFLYFYSKQKLSFKSWEFDKKIAASLLKSSWPLILSGLFILLYMRIDQVMIKHMIGNSAVGEYSAAIKLSEVWFIIPIVVSSSLFPAILSVRENRPLYFARLQKMYDVLVWFAISVAVITQFIGHYIVELLYGSQYTIAGDVLIIHIWTGVFVFLGVAFSKYLVSENMVKKDLYKTIVGVVCNVSLNYLLIPIYGITGAAMATLTSQIVANIGYDIIDKDLHPQLLMKIKSLVPIHIIRKLLK